MTIEIGTHRWVVELVGGCLKMWDGTAGGSMDEPKCLGLRARLVIARHTHEFAQQSNHADTPKFQRIKSLKFEVESIYPPALRVNICLWARLYFCVFALGQELVR